MAYPKMAGPTVVLNVYGTGAGTVLPLLSCTYSFHRGEQSTLTAVIDNASGDFGPTCAIFDCTTVDEDYVPLRWFQLEITGGQTGVTWKSPYFLQDDHHAVEDAQDATVTVQFTDLSESLFVGDQMMDDVETTSATLKMAKATIAEILEAYGIENYDMTGYTDHAIAMLHRVGTPMDWIREIIDRRQGWWYFEEDTFMLFDGGNWSASNSPDLEFTGNEHLTILNYRRTKQSLFNQAVCQRVDATSGLALEFTGEARGTTEDHALDFACISCTARVWAPTAGVPPYDFEWLDDEDNVIGTLATYTGSTPAVAVRFVLEPEISAPPEYQVPYELYVQGTAENSNATITSNYTATYADSFDQALNGKRPLKAVITAPTVLNQTDADDYVQRVVLESVISYAQAEIETILDATVTPGITVGLTVKRSRLTDHRMMCLGGTFNINLDGLNPSALMTLELTANRQAPE